MTFELFLKIVMGLGIPATLEEIKNNKSILYLGEVFEKKAYSRQQFSEWGKKSENNKKISDTMEMGQESSVAKEPQAPVKEEVLFDEIKGKSILRGLKPLAEKAKKDILWLSALTLLIKRLIKQTTTPAYTLVEQRNSID